MLKTVTAHREDIVFEINDELVITNVWTKDSSKLRIPEYRYLNKKFESLIDQYPCTELIFKMLLEKAIEVLEMSFEYQLSKNPNPIWNKARIFVLKENSNKTYCLQISDITNSKNAEENLNQKLTLEKEITDLKNKFVMLSSHEFKTNLTSISLSNELISMYLKQINMPNSDRLDKHIQIIQSEVKQMSNLLNKVFDFGKIYANKKPYNLRETKLNDAVMDIMENLLFTHKIPKKIKIDIKGKPYKIKMNIKVLEHILENIFNNAFKYSVACPDPILEIDFQRNQIILALQDFGIGIPKLDQPKLFEPFYRASNTNKIDGVGLGLVIVKNMVEILQGNLKLESEEGKGTRIEIIFKK
jgi:signal transduction histidine kinase